MKPIKKLNRKSWYALSAASMIGGLAALAALAGGCVDDTNTWYYDYLHASGTVTQADGTTPIANVAIQAYDWIVSYTDGSTVSVPFAPGVSTDASGKFAFDSAKLALQSGNLAESCTDVCVEYSTNSVEYCANYETEYGNEYCADWETSNGNEYCADWEYDEYGNEYCADWEYEPGNEYCADWEQDVIGTTCTDWEWEDETYCSAWGQDCEYYYPARDIGDIAQTYSEITFATGASTLTTQSAGVTLPGAAVTSSSTLNNASGNTTIDTFWSQNDLFVTPLVYGATASTATARTAASTQSLTPKQAEILKARLAKHIKRPNKHTKGVKASRTHKPATHTPFAKLPKELQALVIKARTGCGATPKSAK